MPNNTTPLEKGNIYFFYSPKVNVEKAESFEDVQRLYVVLNPTGKKSYRLMVVPQKKLPTVAADRKNFAFIDKVVKNPRDLRPEMQEETYETKTRGTQTEPAFRPIGEGVYTIVEHEDHTHLAYALELPKKLGEVQKILNIGERGNLIISVKNPDKPSPPNTSLPEDQEAEYPKKLQSAFEDRRFIRLKPTNFLDYPGTQLLLIAADVDELEELEVALNPQEEDESKAEIFNDLELLKSKHPIEPLFEGKWA